MISLKINGNDYYIILTGEIMYDGYILNIHYDEKNEKKELILKNIIKNWSPILDYHMIDFYEENQDLLIGFTPNSNHPLNNNIPNGIGHTFMIRNGITVDKIAESPLLIDQKYFILSHL